MVVNIYLFATWEQLQAGVVVAMAMAKNIRRPPAYFLFTKFFDFENH